MLIADGYPGLQACFMTVLTHEFGHALHGLCSNVDYPSLSGTNVARDYVEFPSQILEHWLPTPEILEGFRQSYKHDEVRFNALAANPIDSLVLNRSVLDANDKHFSHRIRFKGVTDQHQSGIFNGLVQQLKGPDEILQAFLSGKSADVPDDAGRLGQSQYLSSGGPSEQGGWSCCRSVGDHGDSFSRDSQIPVEGGDTLGVGSEAVSAVGQLAIKPELPTGFPGIDAAFTDDNAGLRWGDAWQSDECIGGEQE